MSSGDAETFCNGDDKLAQYQIPEIWLGADSDIEWADRGGFVYWNDDTSFDYNNLVNGYCCKGVYCLSMNSTDGQWYPIPIASCNQQQLPFICQPPKNSNKGVFGPC
uniref:Uncharacterized protein n=1 Tax=Acrobeloides nanus TaxID=290746 RepID=A0A914ECS5_9BILA